MKRAIIIHGYNDEEEFLDASRPAASNDHWIAWLQRQLLLNKIEAQAPEMPGFFQPNYESWKKMLDRFEPDSETMLIGHSCGGGFLVRWLSESKAKVGKVVLVAPWLDPDHVIDPDFFNFEIDSNIAQKTNGLVVMYSTDDDESILKTVEILKQTLHGAQFQEFKNKGHFVLGSLGTHEFPELLANLI